MNNWFGYSTDSRVWLIPRISDYLGYNDTGALLYPLSELDRVIIMSAVEIIQRRDAWGDVTDAQWKIISDKLSEIIERIQ